MEFIFHLLELTTDTLGWLRNTKYRDRDAVTFKPVEGQAALEHAVSDQALPDQAVPRGILLGDIGLVESCFTYG